MARFDSAVQRAGALDRAERYLSEALHAVNKATEALAEAHRHVEADRVEEIGDKLATWRNWVAAS